jgi:hypothetical protein
MTHAQSPVESVQFLGSSALKVHDRTLRDQIVVKCRSLFKVDPKSNVFAGPQPSSLLRQQLKDIQQEEYIVMDKTDGVRHLLLLTSVGSMELICLINRANDVWVVPGLSAPIYLYKDTLVDGEIVQLHNGQWKFVGFDGIHSSGISLTQYRYTDRVTIAKNVLSQIQPHDCNVAAPFSCSVKPYIVFGLGKLRAFIEAVKNMPYKTDGLILTPNNLPVQTGTHKTMFKLKRESDHTVDLLVRFDSVSSFVHLYSIGHSITVSGKQQLTYDLVSTQSSESTFRSMSLQNSVHSARLAKQCQERIVEFRETEGVYHALCIREKDLPNSSDVVAATITNKKENIQFSELVTMDVNLF